MLFYLALAHGQQPRRSSIAELPRLLFVGEMRAAGDGFNNVRAASPEAREQALIEALDLRFVREDERFDVPVSQRWLAQFNTATQELLIHYPPGAVFIDGDLRGTRLWVDWLSAVVDDPAGGVVVVTPSTGAADPAALEEAIRAGTAVWVRSRWRLLDVAPAQTLEEIGAAWTAMRTWAYRSVMDKEISKE